jgi:hypothetical protein
VPALVEEYIPFFPRYMPNGPDPEQSIKPSERSYQNGVSPRLSWSSTALNHLTPPNLPGEIGTYIEQ